MTKCVLSIDIGTSKVHANLISLEDGSTLLGCKKSYQWFHPVEGWSEADVTSEWEITQDAVEEILSKAEGKYEILAIGFSFIGAGLLFMDKLGNPVMNMILAMDQRATAEANYLQQNLADSGSSFAKYKSFAASLPPAKVLWFKRNKLEEFNKTALIGNIQHYFCNKLGLGFFTDQAVASGSGFYNTQQREYNKELCSLMGFPVELLGKAPEFGDTLLGEISKFGRVNLGKKLPVILGTYDVACGMLGLGSVPSTRPILANVTGTYDHIGRVIAEYQEGLLVAGGPIKNTYVQLTGAVVSGPNLDWYIKTFYPDEDLSIINKLFDLNPLDGNNKVVLTKDFNSGDGTLKGINLTSTNGDIFKAIIEGLTYPLIDAVKAASKNGEVVFDSLRIGGGSAKSDKWSQLKSDIFGMRVEKVSNLEISSVGAAILASVAIGYYSDYSNAMKNMVRVEQSYEPNLKLTKIYEERYIEYLQKK